MRFTIIFKAEVIAAFILSLCLIIALTGPFARTGDPGVGWHLRTGELVVKGVIPSTDPFLIGGEEREWISNQWLADAFLWSARQYGGWEMLDYLVVLIGGLAIVLTLMRLSSTVLSVLAISIGLPVLLALGSVQWIVRPVIFSFLGFSLLLILCHYRAMGRITSPQYLGGVAVLFAIWANVHPGFMLGFVPLAGMVLASFWAPHREDLRTALGALLLAGIATCINPYGYELHRSALGLVGDPFFMQLNSEWRPAEFRRFPYIVLPCAIGLLLITPEALRNRPVFERFTVCVLLILSLTARRYISFLVITLIPVVLIALHEWVRRLLAGSTLRALTCDQELHPRLALKCWGWLAALFVFGGCISYQVRTVDEPGLDEHFPKAAVDFLAPSIESKRIFHTPDWGGYLTWKFFPERVATIDDRNELNGKAAYERYLHIARTMPGWRTMLEEGSYTHILTAPDTTLAGALEGDAGWIEVFRDAKAVVFEGR